MHGMICKALEGYVRSTHGDALWDQACRDAGIGRYQFESMLSYPDGEFHDVLTTCAANLRRPVPVLLEDMGMWIVTYPPLAPVRRLFRFSGATFPEFMMSLDEMDARAQMALPNLILPKYHVTCPGDGDYLVTSSWTMQGGGAVLAGVLRALADEYGALVMLEVEQSERLDGIWRDQISVQLIQEDFQTPSTFLLGQVQ